MIKPILPLFITSIHGKLSKKSNIVYRFAYGRQQCYILNYILHPPTNSQAQRRQIFAHTNSLVWKDLRNPARKAHWQQIASQSNIPNYSDRKAAFAHYDFLAKASLKAKLTTKKTPRSLSPDNHFQSIYLFLNLFFSQYKTRNTQNIPPKALSIKH